MKNIRISRTFTNLITGGLCWLCGLLIAASLSSSGLSKLLFTLAMLLGILYIFISTIKAYVSNKSVVIDEDNFTQVEELSVIDILFSYKRSYILLGVTVLFLINLYYHYQVIDEPVSHSIRFLIGNTILVCLLQFTILYRNCFLKSDKYYLKSNKFFLFLFIVISIQTAILILKPILETNGIRVG